MPHRREHELVFFQMALWPAAAADLYLDTPGLIELATLVSLPAAALGSPKNPLWPEMPLADTLVEHLGPPTRVSAAGAVGTYRSCPQGTGWCLSLYQYPSNTASLGHTVRTAMMERLVGTLKTLDAHLALRTTPCIPYFRYMSGSAPNLRPGHWNRNKRECVAQG
ncbi:hypothetical protein EDB86DRAFT_2372638 [Lactarius hatsudake]|nr:hypothetical protein EDB86DRAFT_2372638 [Lactarius hatsudake]